MNDISIFMQILNMSIASSFVIAAVLLVRIFMRGLPRKYSFLLWLIVGIRLACPVFVASPFSLFNLAGDYNIGIHISEDLTKNIKGNMSNVTVLPTAGHSTPEETTTPLPPNEDSSIQKSVADTSPKSERSQETPDRRDQESNSPTVPKSAETSHEIPDLIGREPYSPANPKEAETSQKRFGSQSRKQIQTDAPKAVKTSLAEKVLSRPGLLHSAAVIWVLGMAGILSWNLYLALRMRGQLRKAVLYSGGSCETTATDNKGNIYECDGIASPFVVGLIKPKIYIPFRLRPEELSYILKHEQYHISRKDYLTKLIACILTGIHWFNPLVWAAFHAMTRDMEISCDEYVLTEMGAQIKQDYSQSLLAFATNQRRFSMSLLAFGETDTRKRVKHIMKFKKKKKWMGILSIAILLMVSTACLTDNQASEAKNEPPQALQTARTSVPQATAKPSQTSQTPVSQAAAKPSQASQTPIPQTVELQNIIPTELQNGEPLTAEKARSLMDQLANQDIPSRHRSRLDFDETSDTSYYTEAIYDRYEGYEKLNHSVLEQYQGNQSIWSVVFDHSYIDGCTILEDGAAVYGHHPSGGENDEYYNWIALVSSSGEMLWQAVLNNGFVGEPVFDIIEEPNGLVVISWGDNNSLCYARYNRNGERISYKKYETASQSIERLIPCSDGYILQLRGEDGGGEMIRMQKDGSITETYTYARDEKDYFCTDAVEYNGKLYISAYAVPQLPRGGGWGLPYVFNEEAPLVLNTIFYEDDFDFTNEQLNELVKSNYTAILFVCDPESGEIKLLQSVDAAVGQTCSIDANEHLVWNAAKIKNAYLSFEYHPLYIGGFYIGGESGITRYIYDRKEQLLSRQETGHTVEFRR